MKVLFRANLKTRLFLLILFAFIPAFGLAIVSSVQRLHAQQMEQQGNALRLVRVMEVSHRELLAQASAVLEAISRLTPRERLTTPQCQAAMRDLTQHFPRFRTFGLAASNGDVYCSAQPARLNGNIAHLRFFKDAVTTHMTASGPYEMDTLVPAAVVYIGVPITDASGQILAVLFAALDLSGFVNWSGALQLQPDSLIVMFDQAGLVLARYRDSLHWTGSYRPQAPLVQYARQHGEEGVADLPGPSGIKPLYAYTAVHKTAEQTVFLGLGIAVGDAYAGARQAFRYDMISLAQAIESRVAALQRHRLEMRQLREIGKPHIHFEGAHEAI